MVFGRSRNPFRPFCKLWFWSIIRLPVNACLDIRDFIHRGIYGWAKDDAFDFVSTHSESTLGLLKHFRKTHRGYPDGMTEEEWNESLDMMIAGWQAMNDLAMDTKWELPDDEYFAWRRRMEIVWAAGMEEFVKHYQTIWS